MATFGDLERALADLYPYRWAIGAVVIVLIAGVLAFGWWRGWHLWALRYRKPLVIVSVPLLLVTLWLGWSLGLAAVHQRYGGRGVPIRRDCHGT